MEERDTSQLEVLTKIHNQLVDLKKIIVETELARPGTGQALQTQLRQLIADDQHIGIPHPGALEKQQKVIAPQDTNIEPGEGSKQ